MNSVMFDLIALFSLLVGLVFIGMSIKKSFRRINASIQRPNINVEKELLSVEKRRAIQKLLTLSIAQRNHD